MNNTIITDQQVADLRNVLEEIRRLAAQPASVPAPSSYSDNSPVGAAGLQSRLNHIERLARKALKNVP